MKNIIERLEDAAIYGQQPCPVASEAAGMIAEVREYLIAASDGSMSQNNSEALACELLEKIVG